MTSRRELRRLAGQIEALKEIERPTPARFQEETNELTRDAEATRLRYMQARQNRVLIATFLGLLAATGGVGGFGWFFLVAGNFKAGLACLIPAAVVPAISYMWTKGPLKSYERAHKGLFMPKMAHALGGFRYSAEGGVSSKILPSTGVVPDHSRYETEDCFMGLYKGVKVIFSEARLYKGSRGVFEGLFILLEAQPGAFDGRAIITADKKMMQDYAATRWKKLSPVSVTVSNEDWGRFFIFADKPDNAAAWASEKLLKELSEAADIFNRAPLTLSVFGGRYIFIAIPSKDDMFEASDVEQPIPASQNAQERRREVEKLLEVIDVIAEFGVRSEE